MGGVYATAKKQAVVFRDKDEVTSVVTTEQPCSRLVSGGHARSALTDATARLGVASAKSDSD
jgi:hypothetical protein